MTNTIPAHSPHKDYIYLSLLHLGAAMWSSSSKRLLLALQYTAAHSEVTDSPLKCLYAELAASQKCSYPVIERSLRYAINRIWTHNQAECARLLYRSDAALHKPTVSEFICLYTDALSRGSVQAWVDSIEAGIF